MKCAYTYCTGPWLLLDLEFRNYGSDNLGIPLTYRLNLDHSVYERSLNHTESIWSISHTFQKMKVQCINISRCWQCHPLKKAHLSKWPQKRSPKTGYMHRSTAVIRTGNGELGQPIHTCVTKWPAVEIVTGRSPLFQHSTRAYSRHDQSFTCAPSYHTSMIFRSQWSTQ